MGNHEGTLQIEYDDISMKSRLILTRFGVTLGPLRIDENIGLEQVLHYWVWHDFGTISLLMPSLS